MGKDVKMWMYFSPLSNKLPVCELDEKDDEGSYDRKDCDVIPIDIDLENE